jgi:hypothetical protein
MAKLLAASAGWNSQRLTMRAAKLYRLTETASDELLKHSDGCQKECRNPLQCRLHQDRIRCS